MNDHGGWDRPAPVVPNAPSVPPPPAPTPQGGPQWHGAPAPAVQTEPPSSESTSPPTEPRVADHPDGPAAELAQIWRDARADGPERRRFRSTGTRITGRGVLWVGGLLGVLLTVGILGLLGARVLSSVDDRGRSTERVLDVAAGDGAPVTCQADRRTLETALQAYELRYGAPASDQQALVDVGLLAEPIDAFAYDPVGDEQLVGVGACRD